MARRRRGFGGGGSQRQMMQQVQKLQEEMLKAQEELGEETVEVTVGGGVVRIVMTGHQKLETVEIDPDVLDPDDVEMLQDLIIAAVNEAVDKSQDMAADRMSAFTGGLNIPGLGM
ncbi:MAG: Nucleoid-associated protein [Anaerolineales bacterium]|nr:Nucleoid-associated protein [Anaerolineales bacterium]